MSACEFSAMLSPFYDGELEQPQHDQVEHHLGECSNCAEEIDQMHAISRALSMLVVPDAPARLLPRIEAGADKVEEIMLVRFVRRLTAVAAALLVLAVGRVALMSQPEPTPAPALASWELSAIDPDPTTALASNDSQFSDSQFDEFIVHDLAGEIQ